ncbi:hypothetical protein [Saccharothrix xinjiangensis]|uniref:Uncharacterized protein n=1 Tax=Saccharothrix xinjiangensis TaxID=204798 RepID=A0ABV9YEM1_9PSEU
MKAVQLPRDARGQRLCRHEYAGGCTWWCSYRRGVVCVGPAVGLLAAACVMLWLWGDEAGRQRAVEAAVGMLLVAGAGAAAVLVAERASDRI